MASANNVRMSERRHPRMHSEPKAIAHSKLGKFGKTYLNCKIDPNCAENDVRAPLTSCTHCLCNQLLVDVSLAAPSLHYRNCAHCSDCSRGDHRERHGEAIVPFSLRFSQR